MTQYYPKGVKIAAFVFGLAAACAAPVSAFAAPLHEASGNFVGGNKGKKTAAAKSGHKAVKTLPEIGQKGETAPRRKAAPKKAHTGHMQQNAWPQRAQVERLYYRPFAVQKPRPYEKAIHQMAHKYNVPEDLIHAVVNTESGYNYLTRGGVGEIGLMQIRPGTARLLGYTGPVKGLYNPLVNLEYGTRYLALAQYLSGGSLCGTVLKYNAGHGATRMNPISFRYCQKVKAYLYAVGYR